MIRYFGYGSNINLTHLRLYLSTHGADPDDLTTPCHAVLSGYRLRTNYLSPVHKAGACNIEPADRHTVEGVVIDVTPAVQEVLRTKEGWPDRYRETDVPVSIIATGEVVTVVTYIVTPECRLADDLPVTKRYRDLILQGAADFGFSPAYRQKLHTLLRSLPESRPPTRPGDSAGK